MNIHFIATTTTQYPFSKMLEWQLTFPIKSAIIDNSIIQLAFNFIATATPPYRTSSRTS